MRRVGWWVAGVVTVVAMGTVSVIAVEAVKAERKRVKLDQQLEQAHGLALTRQYPEAITAYKRLILDASEAPQTRQARLDLIDLAVRVNRLLEAKEECLTFLQLYPSDPAVPQVTQRLGDVNLAIWMSPIQMPQSTEYVIQAGDSLDAIAKAHNTTVAFLIKANRLRSSAIRPGMRLKVPNKVRWGVVVDKSLNLLTLKANDELIKTYRVSTGNNTTPVGRFHVVNKVVNPVWYREGVAIPPDSPENILGSRWMGFDKSGYGIHGTTQPETIGQQVTAGCVRMHNRDVEELFTILPLGTDVTIVD